MSDIAVPLFDYLVGDRQHVRRDCETERGGGLKVDRQLELRREPDRQVARIPSFENGQTALIRAFTEKTESRGSPAGTNRIQGSYWNGGQHGWRNRIRRICVGALLVRGKMVLPSRKLRSNLE